MGICDLYSIIREHCPEVMIETSLSNFSGYRIAVDISIFLNKYVKSAGPQRWIENFILLLCCLKKHGIKTICIFDGPNPPIEKRQEQDRRKEQWVKKSEKIDEMRRMLTLLETEYVSRDGTDTPLDIDTKNTIRRLLSCARRVDNVNYDDVYDVIDGLKMAIERNQKQNMPILPEYSQYAREVIQHMGLAHMTADGEAETLCAYLCLKGEVDAVLTEDTDVLAYGTPMFLAKIDITKEKVTSILHSHVLECLGFDVSEFRDLCILLSCDYNNRIKGYPPDGKKRKKPVCVGAKGAFAMIREYRSIENSEEYMVDSSPLNYKRCRELFTVPPLIPGAVVPYNRPIDEKKLARFIDRHKIRTPLSYILETWRPAKLIFHLEPSREESPYFNFESSNESQDQ